MTSKNNDKLSLPGLDHQPLSIILSLHGTWGGAQACNWTWVTCRLKAWGIWNLAVTDFLSDLQAGKSGPYWTWLIVTDFLSDLQAGKSEPYWTWLSMISWVSCRMENRGHIEPGCQWFHEWLANWKIGAILNLAVTDFLNDLKTEKSGSRGT